MDPLRIQVHPSDNVAIVVNPEGLPTGTTFADGLRLVEHIPQSHKVALKRFAAGEPIVRYGQVIGQANREILPHRPRPDAVAHHGGRRRRA